MVIPNLKLLPELYSTIVHYISDELIINKLISNIYDVAHQQYWGYYRGKLHARGNGKFSPCLEKQNEKDQLFSAVCWFFGFLFSICCRNHIEL